MKTLANKTALVTGATSGIGLATSYALAGAGCNLVLIARRTDRLTRLGKAIHDEYKVQVDTSTLDVRHKVQVNEFFTDKKMAEKNFDILINNAGLARGVDPLPSAQEDDLEEMIDTNVKGLLFITRPIAKKMVARKSGHIVNLGSVAGRWVYPGGAVYCASKFAVRALTEGLRLDMQGTGVRVSNIAPGLVETEFSEVRLRDAVRAKAVYSDTVPLTAADVADAILWTVTRPAHVNVQEMILFPVDQAGVGYMHRKGR